MEIHPKRIRLAVLAALGACTTAAYALHRGAPELARAPSAAPSATTPIASSPPSEAPHIAQAAIAGDGKVELSAHVDRSAVMAGGDGLVHVRLDLSAAAGQPSEAARPPSDMLVVLDISGSMQGQKLDYAKQATSELIDRLAPSDRMGLVVYESDARVIFPMQAASQQNVVHWHRLVSALGTEGGTNMSAGLDLALQQLEGSRAQGRSARVLLLSDGQANAGDASVTGLRARASRVIAGDHVLSAMGVGEDFNEDLMTSLANVGAGNFYYLSRVDMLGRFFDAELKAATDTVASAVELQFRPAKGVKVLDVSGYPLQQSDGMVWLRPGNLVAGQQRTLWMTLAVPTTQSVQQALGSMAVAYQHDHKPARREAGALPLVAVVGDAQRFEQAVDKGMWEEFVSTEQFNKAQLGLGAAIGNGTAEDVDREVANYEQNRELAQKLGSTRVIERLDALKNEGVSAKQRQQADSSVRSYEAKQTKSRAYFDRRKGAYLSDPKAGL